MPIINYANRVNPTKVRIDQQKPLRKKTISDGGDINGGSISRVFQNGTWNVTNINVNFDSTAVKDFKIGIANGITVVQDRNDYLWIKLIDESIKFATFHKKIILSPGFYSGSELASELQAKLNDAFSDYAITFTGLYNATTGLFSIEASSAKIAYLHINPVMPHTKKDSIGGILFGLTENNVPDTILVSDTPFFGLNSISYISNEEATDATSYINNDTFKLSLDQALVFEGNGAESIIMTYTINCEIDD